MDFTTLFSTYGKYAFLLAYCLYAVFATNKGKPLAWFASHALVILAGGWAIAQHVDYYLMAGGVVGAVNTVRQLATKQLSLSNPLALGKSLVEDVLAFPVGVFEDAYKAITKQPPVA